MDSLSDITSHIPVGEKDMESHSHREITEVKHSWETSIWNPLSGVKEHPAVSDTRGEENWKSCMRQTKLQPPKKEPTV